MLILCETDSSGTVIKSYAYDLSGHPVASPKMSIQIGRPSVIHTNTHRDVIHNT